MRAATVLRDLRADPARPVNDTSGTRASSTSHCAGSALSPASEREHAFVAGLPHRAVDDVLDGDGGERRLGGRFPDHHVAAHRSDEGIPRPHRSRES